MQAGNIRIRWSRYSWNISEVGLLTDRNWNGGDLERWQREHGNDSEVLSRKWK